MTSKSKKALAAMLVGAGLFAVSAASMAQAQAGRFYVGGSFGQAELSDFCSDMDFLVAGIGAVASCDEKDSAWKFFGGYRVNPNFAVEASYIDFGEVSARGQTFGVPFSVRASATAWGVAALGILPVGQLSLFGKMGLLMTDAKASASGIGGSFSDSETDTGLHIGFGAMVDVTPAFSIRAEWEREDENEIDMMTLGIQVRF